MGHTNMAMAKGASETLSKFTGGDFDTRSFTPVKSQHNVIGTYTDKHGRLRTNVKFTFVVYIDDTVSIYDFVSRLKSYIPVEEAREFWKQITQR